MPNYVKHLTLITFITTGIAYAAEAGGLFEASVPKQFGLLVFSPLMMWLSIKGRHNKLIARLSVGLLLGFFIPAYILDSPEQLGQLGVNIIAASLLLAVISNCSWLFLDTWKQVAHKVPEN
jgi:hypothetical protein